MMIRKSLPSRDNLDALNHLKFVSKGRERKILLDTITVIFCILVTVVCLITGLTLSFRLAREYGELIGVFVLIGWMSFYAVSAIILLDSNRFQHEERFR